MWWHRKTPEPDTINPYLGVGYTAPEQWSVREHESPRGLQFLPPATLSTYPASLFLQVFPDRENWSPKYAIRDHIESMQAAAGRFTQHGRDFSVHPGGFVYASVDYTIESDDITRRESHHLIAFGIDGRTAVTASSFPGLWSTLEPIRDALLASLILQDPGMAVRNFFNDDASS